MPSKKSSSSNARFVLFATILPAVFLGGCADYVKRRDTITLAAGEAQSWNSVVHTADPWPPYVMNTHIHGDGQRTQAVIQRYSAGPAGDQQGGAAAPAPANP
ncbi:hypothetical protein AB4Y85_05685 [Microvirga sp. 2YAF29]|uniref:hypothetical protein n=1 Tax=Microvirga sp. 2YAF29 TaxID=3233031 RepID=UPI003F96032F